MYWQIANINQRLKSTYILWFICTFICIAWALNGNIQNVEFIANQPWVSSNVKLLKIISDGSMYLFYIFFIGLIFFGKFRQRAELRLIGWAYVIAQLVGSVFIVRTLKILLGHARPDAVAKLASDHTDIWKGPSIEAMYNGFPSGHTSDYFISGIFLSICLPKWWMRIIVMSFAMFNGFLRVALIKHFPLDVLGGTVIAGLVAFAVWKKWLIPRIEAN